MRTILPGAIAAIVWMAGCSLDLGLDAMPSWVEGTRSPFQDGPSSASYRFVPISLTDRYPELWYDPVAGVSVEPAPEVPGYLLVYVYSDVGPEEMIPVLDVSIGGKAYWCQPSEYAYGPPLLPWGAILEEKEADEGPKNGPLMISDHQFRYAIVIDSLEPITIRVARTPGLNEVRGDTAVSD